MYEDFYGLSASPFRLTPDHKFYFGSEAHRKAMSYLKYGLYQGEGFIVITGDVGLGKSTMLAQLFSDLDEGQVVAAQINTTQIDADDAIRMICRSFGIGAPGDDKSALLNAFEQFLKERNSEGKRVLLVVDEAQNLPVRSLEELRMLSNFNVDGQPLFQGFLVGQPQFMRTLAHPDLAQLNQRVIASFRLQPMSLEETRDYIAHRLETVGWQGNPEIDASALEAVYEDTGGVPRKINTLCNRLMLYGALEELKHIDRGVVETVVADMSEEAHRADTEFDAAPGPMSGDPNHPDLRPAGAALPAQPGSGYAPHLDEDASSRLEALGARVERLERLMADHEKALRDLIDVTVNQLAPTVTAQDEAAPEKRRAEGEEGDDEEPPHWSYFDPNPTSKSGGG
ncbi:MAG: XrtA/PEP-CTERM system-associated ATPase [Pseudomonadota bacterium]